MRSRRLVARILAIVARKIRGEFPNDEFLEDIDARGRADADEGGLKRQANTVAIARRIIQIRKATRGQVAKDVGVVGLPAAIVALADHRIGDGI